MQPSSANEQNLELDREAILDAWGRAVVERHDAAVPAPRSDAVGPLVEWLTRQVDLRDDSPAFDPMVRELVHARVAEGGELGELVAEYSLLRDCITGSSGGEGRPAATPEGPRGTRALHLWLDRAVAVAIDAFTEARDRSLAAIETVSKVSLHSVGVDELFQRLLDAVEDVAPRVDAAAIALCEGEQLRVYAASGAAEGLEGSTQRIGEGFLGRIVSERRSLSMRPVEADPLTLPPKLRRSGIRTIYGAPMVEGGEVFGVVLMGSCTTFDFPRNDLIVFDVLARHAASAIRYRNTRESLEREKARIEALLASMPAGVIVVDAPSGDVILYNHQAEAIWRRPLPRTLCGDECDAWVAYHRDGRAVDSEEWGLARAIHHGETVINQEVDILRGNGRRGTILNSAAPIRADGARIVGAVATFTDITEKRKTESQLQRALAQAQRAETLQRILAEAGEKLAEALDKESVLGTFVALAVPKVADHCGIFVADDRRGVTVRDFASVDPVKAALMREYHGRHARPKGHFENAFMLDLLDRRAPKIFMRLTDETCIAMAAGDRELLVLLRGLEMTSAMFVPVVARGRALGVAVFACSTPGREFAPDDVELAEALTRCSAIAVDNHGLYQAAQDAARQREEILAIVSHDLRNALSSVELNAEILASKPLSEAGRSRVDRIIAAARRMGHFIRDLVDSAAIATGSLAVEKRPNDVNAIVRATAGLFEPAAQQRGITLTIDAGEGFLGLRCDAARIGQVLENLISNALKVTDSGGAVHVRTRGAGEEVVFSVVDTGSGMTSDVIAHLFERYYRGHSPKGQGLGLGLSIAKAIVGSHGGRIWVESAPGKGSTFSFAIPVSAP